MHVELPDKNTVRQTTAYFQAQYCERLDLSIAIDLGPFAVDYILLSSSSSN